MSAERRKVITELNRLRGSSASGRYLAVNWDTGEVGSHLFTQGQRPLLEPGWTLVKIGPRYRYSDFDFDDEEV